MKSLFAIGLGFLLIGGCSADDEIKQEIDCFSICQRYSECFDEDYDVSACQDRCEDEADQDPTFADDIEACDRCIDDESCAGGLLSCTTECAGIVP